MISVAVVDYGAGNIRSAAKALEAAGAARVIVTSDPSEITAADRIVLPGVGAFAQCIAALRGTPGVVDALEDAVLERGKPFLGICVGMQLLATTGHEHGEHAGLGWIDGDVVRIEPGVDGLKVPHIGWNDVVAGGERPGLPPLGSAYFVHSYRFAAADPASVLATTDYGREIAAVIGRDNITGVQFHPEKSQNYGLNFLRGWLSAPLELEGLGMGLTQSPLAEFIPSPTPNPSRSKRGEVVT